MKKDKNKTDSAGQEPAYIQNEKRIKELEQMIVEEKNARLKALADYVNYKKQVEKERSCFKIEANKQILMEIIDVIDDYERALSNISDKPLDEQSVEGLKIILEKLNVILKFNGIEAVDIRKGSDFNPSTMLALTTVEPEDVELKGKVVDIVQKGYVYSADKKVFKTAKIILGKN